MEVGVECEGGEGKNEGCDIVGYFNDSLFGTLLYKQQASLFIQKPNKE